MSAVHPNDQLYALDRAIAACVAAGEPANVISDLRAMRDDVQRSARGPVSRPVWSSAGNPPATNTGD